jgi:hypothetical protein
MWYGLVYVWESCQVCVYWGGGGATVQYSGVGTRTRKFSFKVEVDKFYSPQLLVALHKCLWYWEVCVFGV